MIIRLYSILFFLFTGITIVFSQNKIYASLENFGIKCRSIKLEANSNTAQKLDFEIGLNDFVFFIVKGNIKLNNIKDNVFGFGIDDEKAGSLTGNKKYKNAPLGAVLCGIENLSTFYKTEKRNDKFFKSNPCSENIPEELWVNGDIPCFFFLSPNKGKLVFEINSNITAGNSGQFTVDIYTIPKDKHTKRNAYNHCSKNEPKQSKANYMDCNNAMWDSEGACGKYYHSGGTSDWFRYSAYRGIEKKTAGCQCVYNSDGKLVTDDEYAGSFDYGFWVFDGNSKSSEASFLHRILDVIPHELYKSTEYPGTVLDCNVLNNTLFLLDVSGSMAENNKWQSSKQSAISALSSIANQTNGSSQTPAISVKTFEGGCVTNPTKNVIDFTTNLQAVEDALKNKIPPPGGGTPLPQAIKIAEDALKVQLKQTNQCKGTLIILTDGQSTCGSIRPQGTFAYTETKQVTVDCNTASGSFKLKYNTIGFDIPPGSEAERDLQYISSSSGGRYFYAKDSFQLQKAFEKLSRAYIPIEKNQSNARTSEKGKQFFNKAVGFIKSNDFDTAYKMMQLFLAANPADSAAIYNYALMSEATENYKEAISYYSKYLKQNPNNVNKQQIEQQIKKISQYVNEDKEYHLKIIQTDFTFLEASYKKLTNKQNIARSNEFTGFIKEKGSYYNKLIKILGSEDASLNSLIKQIADGFTDAERYITYKSTDWDKYALPVIGLIYLKMQSLIQKVK